jgi:hypothetical protein
MFYSFRETDLQLSNVVALAEACKRRKLLSSDYALSYTLIICERSCQAKSTAAAAA